MNAMLQAEQGVRLRGFHVHGIARVGPWHAGDRGTRPYTARMLNGGQRRCVETGGGLHSGGIDGDLAYRARHVTKFHEVLGIPRAIPAPPSLTSCGRSL